MSGWNKAPPAFPLVWESALTVSLDAISTRLLSARGLLMFCPSMPNAHLIRTGLEAPAAGGKSSPASAMCTGFQRADACICTNASEQLGRKQLQGWAEAHRIA